MTKIKEQAEASPNKNTIKFKPQVTLPLRNSQNLPLSSSEKMNQENFHWGATTEIMETIRRREKSLGTRRLVDRRVKIGRPGMMRRRYGQNAQRKVWVPSRPNKRSREEITGIDGVLIQRAKQIGVGYQPIQELENNPNQMQMEEQLPEDRFGE